MTTTTPLAPDEPDPAATEADRGRGRLVVHMAAMAEGDAAAVFGLVAEFGDDLARVVRAQLASYGRHDLRRDADELTFLVHTAALAILDRAGSWDPDGAPPWVWARSAIRAAVAHAIGHASVALDLDRLAERPDPAPGPADVDLDELAEREPRFALFREALGGVGERDRAVVEQYLVQQACGDPSPSHTVARELGLTPANVRQIVSRQRARLRQLQAVDHRYRLLGDAGWLAA